jgi:hypothetical protein
MIIQFTHELYSPEDGDVPEKHTLSIFRAHMAMLGSGGTFYHILIW